MDEQVVALSIFEKPASYTARQINHDALWKKVIGELFEDFLLFFAPGLYNEEMRPSLQKEAERLGQSGAWELSPTLSEVFRMEREEALEEGLVKGARKEKEDIVRRLVNKGMELSMIAEVTELDLEEVKEIKRQVH